MAGLASATEREATRELCALVREQPLNRPALDALLAPFSDAKRAHRASMGQR